ncbi:MAG TPA: SpoIIE family protein phosphatase [Mycobacteriales bacterium]|jgi:serine phosphatase RsbU (regulator of sigma subunit)/anti-sigma regulatory factor (Ser/Thr protein kinase)|nr:SpoIIE family protein phosphatase [Mycobacteriales bacterium]
MDVTALEHVVDRDVDAVPRARRFAAQSLRGVDRSVVDDVELVVSELVTNALLHGAAPVVLRLSTLADRVRVEVEDGGRELPVRMRDDIEAMTGRGLALVAQLSNGWGVEPGAGRGKVVWAEVAEADFDEASHDSQIDVDALLAAWSDDDDAAEPTYVVELGAVPTHLLLEAKAHIDNLVREFTLAAGGAGSGGPASLPPDLSELVQTVVHGFSVARSSIKRQALDAAARGDAETRLTLALPATAADAGEKYLNALDEADGYARAARLLTLETPPVHRVFRRWYVESLVAQLRQQAAGEPAGGQQTFLERLADEYTRLAPMQGVAQRLALLQRVTAELTGARDVPDVCRVVVANATGVLGARSAGIFLLDAGIFRLAAADGGDGAGPGYEAFPAAASLPGGDAMRTRLPVVVRNLSDLAERYPALDGVYADERTLLVAPLVVGGHELGVLSLTFVDQGGIDERTQLTLLTTLADVSAQALERATATSAASAATDRLAFLAEASVVLSSSLDYRTVLAAVAGLVVPRLADWCAIQLLENDELETVALTHFDPAKAAWAAQMGERYPTDMTAPSGAPNVIRTGSSELYPDIPAELIEAAAVDAEHLEILRELGMCSGLVVPLTGRTGTFGALTMVHAESGRRYGDDDVAFAEDLARRAALAVETAHAFREQSGRLAEVTRVAEAAQHAILAAPPAQIGPVALAARYVSAAAEALIGGDLFEVVERPDSVRLLIGDVRGKGLDAVRTATVVLGEFRAAAADLDELDQVAAQIDRRLRPYLTDEDFVTAALADISNDGSFALVSCGHPPAFVLAADGITAVGSESSVPLGLGSMPTPVTGSLRPGDRLFLYTDGIIEARDRQGQFIDLHQLLRPVAGDDLDSALERILTGLRSAVGGALADDLAMLVAEFVGEPSTASSTD